MASRINKSLLLLFESDPRAEELNQLRQRVRSEFGGGAALDLPVHMTLYKWRSRELPTALFDAIAASPVRISLQLGDLALRARYRAVWYPARSAELPETFRQASEILNACSINTPRQSSFPHLTVAYRDYGPKTLSDIYQSILRSNWALQGVLRSSGMALASQDAHGKWNLQKGR